MHPPQGQQSSPRLPSPPSQRHMMTTNNNNNNSDKRKKKSVRFVEANNTVSYITHINDMPDDVVDAVWTSEIEYNQIVASYQQTVSRMESGEIPRNDPSTRGLEGRTRVGYTQRFQRRHTAYNAILDEQDAQWDKGATDKQFQYDFDTIAAIYSQYTGPSYKDAYVKAKQDEHDAMMVHRAGQVRRPQQHHHHHQHQQSPRKSPRKQRKSPTALLREKLSATKISPSDGSSSTKSKQQHQSRFHHQPKLVRMKQ